MIRHSVLLVAIFVFLLPADLAQRSNRQPQTNTFPRTNDRSNSDLQNTRTFSPRKHYNADSPSERLSLLVELREKLQQNGINVKFMDKVIKRGTRKLNRRRFEKIIKRAKSKMANKAKGVRKVRNNKKRNRGGKLGVTSAARRAPPAALSTKAQPETPRIRGQLNPCPAGQTRRRGQCRCPSLSTWNSETQQCTCIYGTYRGTNGNCRTYH